MHEAVQPVIVYPGAYQAGIAIAVTKQSAPRVADHSLCYRGFFPLFRMLTCVRIFYFNPAFLKYFSGP